MFLLSVSIIDTWLGTHLYLTVDTKQSLGVNSSSMLFSNKEKKKKKKKNNNNNNNNWVIHATLFIYEIGASFLSFSLA